MTRDEAKEEFCKASDNSLSYLDSTEVILIDSVNIIINSIYDDFEKEKQELIDKYYNLANKYADLADKYTELKLKGKE